ncbi:MAG: hypothetical protein ABIH23_25200 [bacterium]
MNQQPFTSEAHDAPNSIAKDDCDSLVFPGHWHHSAPHTWRAFFTVHPWDNIPGEVYEGLYSQYQNGKQTNDEIIENTAHDYPISFSPNP